jgi:putative oxidoreductase
MRETWRRWAPLPLRLMLGIGFLYHGLPKLFSAEERAGFTGMLAGMGFPAPGLMAWLVGIVEVAGGVMLILGLFILIPAILLIINMLVAMFAVHLPHGFSFINMQMTDVGPVFGMPGVEVNLLYIAGLLSLVLSGAGALSFDRMRAHGATAGPVEPRRPTAAD